MAILNFQKPDKIILQKATDFEAQFEFRPLEPGYGVTIGNVFIRASKRELDVLWHNFLGISVLIALFTLIVTLFVASRLQRFVSGPLEHLTDTVQKIAAKKDYSLRARQESDDEVGVLVRAFNDMLVTIETRNQVLETTNQLLADSEEELKSANENLERKVADRTAEMQALFDSASVGIVLMKDRLIVKCNRRMDEMLGYGYGEQIEKPTRMWYPDEASWNKVGEVGYVAVWRGESDDREQQLVS